MRIFDVKKATIARNSNVVISMSISLAEKECIMPKNRYFVSELGTNYRAQITWDQENLYKNS